MTNYAYTHAVNTICHSTIIRSHTIKQSISLVDIFHRPHSILINQTVSIVDIKQRAARLKIFRLLESIISDCVKLVFLFTITIPTIGAIFPKVKTNSLNQFRLIIPSITTHSILNNRTVRIVATKQRAVKLETSRTFGRLIRSVKFVFSSKTETLSIGALLPKVNANLLDQLMLITPTNFYLHSIVFTIQKAATLLFSRSPESCKISVESKDKAISALALKVKVNEMNRTRSKYIDFCHLHSSLILVMSFQDKPQVESDVSEGDEVYEEDEDNYLKSAVNKASLKQLKELGYRPFVGLDRIKFNVQNESQK